MPTVHVPGTTTASDARVQACAERHEDSNKSDGIQHAPNTRAIRIFTSCHAQNHHMAILQRSLAVAPGRCFSPSSKARQRSKLADAPCNMGSLAGAARAKERKRGKTTKL
eukprot:CAMPEP_0204175160 /NCGR_PEP_ID=MMETSP0361-20130328/46503_1 /ASSEMBLY_ACC=CAM_ASM_000343 /TAXON_ID=268821 /ORGANISM="Scrippsiella Hangoei, Strain SHTV-5" /LENGTH=109 /DNA_ID=CAMNT_0051133763 /DNA_START=42 /DNA_END=371 /DNA_ORIENTATION=+